MTHMLSQHDPATPDAHLADLMDRLTEMLGLGDNAAVEAILNDNPSEADHLRRLLPTLQVLATLDSTPQFLAQNAQSIGGLLGDYKIVREVGRGGMGVVYEAEQISLRRRVALKVLPFAAALDPRQLQRFRNEALAAASLHHEHIIPVYAVGCERGVHFYAMQFIDGCTLADAINELNNQLPTGGNRGNGGRSDTEGSKGSKDEDGVLNCLIP